MLDITTSLLRLIDAVRAILDRVEATGDDGDDGYGELIAALAVHLADETAPVATEASAAETVTTRPARRRTPSASTSACSTA